MKDFLKRLRGDPAAAAEPLRPEMEAGRRLYCVGDIHGRVDLLQELHDRVQRDASRFEGQKTIVYLGDYIDRGMHSREVIDELLVSPLEDFERIHLLGNHEQTMLDFLQYPEQAAGWLTWGGRETLMSYGVSLPPGLQRPDVVALRDELQQELPGSHLEFLQGMALTYVAGDYLFVHAGIRPGIPLQEQRDSDLLWIRQAFLEHEEPHEYVVVHGHSISEEVEMRDNRVGIDTGAFYTGVLTALVLEGEEQRLIQTGGA